ncbi:MAG: PKD domain-containing protein [Chitinophagaceae bacterium]|nr:PKD domain-containing protein [Chitinophagaceae bacterium]
MILKRVVLYLLFLIPAKPVFTQGSIEFVENKGQWDSRVKFKAVISNGDLFIRDKGVTFVQYHPEDYARVMHLLHERLPDVPEEKFLVRTHVFHVDFVNSTSEPEIIPDKRINSYNNYFTGSDPSKWKSDCKIYHGVTLKNIYPDIDVRYYTENGFLKYDLIAKPGADISKIAIRYDGIEKLQIKNKELILKTSVGELRESYPYTYQTTPSGKKEVACQYVVDGNLVRFKVKEYDRNYPLVIDPVLIFCSFSGSSADNWGFTATYGPDGSFYGGGIVFSRGFPVSSGAFQSNFQGGNFDIGIIRLSPNGSNRIFATYIGGSGNEQPHSLVVDNAGNVVLAGRTNSPSTGQGAYPVTGNGIIGPNGSYDIVITKISANGTSLIGSVRLGGNLNDGVNIQTNRSPLSLQQNYGDDGRSEVILDAAGNILVASCTQSANFPVRGNYFQANLGGAQDGVVIKLSPDLSNVIFSGFLGGNQNDAAYVLTLGPDGNIYVAGGTESDAATFPGNKAGTISPVNNGSIDGFISVIHPNGTAILRTTFIGTNGRDQIFGIQFDNRGFLYITGQTTGNWQVVNNLPGNPPIYSNPGGKQFIAKLRPDLSAYIYSTMFGTNSSTPNISITAFLVDRCENVYVSGWGGFYGNQNVFGSAGTTGLPVTPDAIKSVTDGKDFYFFVLRKDASGQLFGSFFGETNNPGAGCDHVDGGTSRFDRNGVIYQAICANCNLDPLGRPIFPTTPGAWSTTNNAGDNNSGCNLAMLKIDLRLAGIDGEVRSRINGRNDTTGCVPLNVEFFDSIGNATSYEWYFNYSPGNPPDRITNNPRTTFTFNNTGTYRVMMVAIDPASCNIRDTSFITIRVGDVVADLRPSWSTVGNNCPRFTYEFINNSVSSNPNKPFQDTSMVWDFGDGSPRVPARTGANNAVRHTFPGIGTYNVRLILKDTTYCNNPDDSVITITIADNVRAIIETPPTGCAPYNASFRSRSQNATSLQWDFGVPGDPGNTSTAQNPSFIYRNPGVYTVRLTAFNPGSCNLRHDTTFTITVFSDPVPDFSAAPDPPIVNTPTVFTNLSSPDATRFKWVFGDGDSLITRSRAPVSHQYNATGTFQACLTAYNNAGCDSTICRPVSALIEPAVDVPNAFTPLSGDENSIVYVRGFGIAKMTFTIWNRWGQKVFETNNRFQGWDGTFKGRLQPMDVYVYTLSVEFSDGKKLTKKGDITLIR